MANPAYEFDGCLDPAGDDSPNGVTFPSALTITSTTADVDAQGRVGLALACGVGAGGCAGDVTAVADGTPLGAVAFHMTEQATRHVTLPGAVPAGGEHVSFTVHASTGVAPSEATLPIQR